MFKYTYIHIYMYIYTYIHVLEILSLCAASWMWVRHRSVVIVPPEGGLEFSAGLTKTILFLFMSRLTNSLGIPLQDCNRVTNHTRFLLLTRSTSVEDCCSRIERGARKIAECTSYTPCVLLSFSPRKHGLDKARAAAVPPGLNISRSSDFSSFSPADHQRRGHQWPHCCSATHLGANLAH